LQKLGPVRRRDHPAARRPGHLVDLGHHAAPLRLHAAPLVGCELKDGGRVPGEAVEERLELVAVVREPLRRGGQTQRRRPRRARRAHPVEPARGVGEQRLPLRGVEAAVRLGKREPVRRRERGVANDAPYAVLISGEKLRQLVGQRDAAPAGVDLARDASGKPAAESQPLAHPFLPASERLARGGR